GGEVHERPPGAEAVDAHQPRPRLVAVTHQPGVGGAVGLVRQPAGAAGHTGGRLVAARVDEVLVAHTAHAEVAGRRELTDRERRRLRVVRAWVVDPPAIAEQRVRFDHLAAHAHVVVAARVATWAA